MPAMATESDGSKVIPPPNKVLVVVDSEKQWAPYFSSDSVVTVDTYLEDETLSGTPFLVLNLCSDMSYLSEGYYCSLLAQARRHKVLPTIETLNRMDGKVPNRVEHILPSHCTCQPASEDEVQHHKPITLDLYFGKTENPEFAKFARAIFEYYPAPLLRVTISSQTPHRVLSLRYLSLDELDDHQQDLFADNLDKFSSKVWRAPRTKKPARYDLAIFHDPDEALPPSNKKALDLFISEARKMGINAELLTEEESSRLLEFDALFIRKTTAVDNITYKLAQTAEQADMVVIDDPTSIVLCTNKVFLQEFFEKKGFPIPKSKLIFTKHPVSYADLSTILGEKIVLKIPDGSFSVGMHKVTSEAEFIAAIQVLSERSSLLLAQEFVPTEYDWRIGVLNGEAIFACKYYMARGHWQIYRHREGGSTTSGKFETLPVHQVPRKIIRLAEKVAVAIGKGFYGVDLKDTGKGLRIIEINDNPSIEHGVEDTILGTELYRMILREFITRLDARRNQ